jgi:hypothetical protein
MDDMCQPERMQFNPGNEPCWGFASHSSNLGMSLFGIRHPPSERVLASVIGPLHTSHT